MSAAIDAIKDKRRRLVEEMLADPIWAIQAEEIEEWNYDSEPIVGAHVLTKWMLITCILDTGDNAELVLTLSPAGATFTERVGLIEVAKDEIRG